MNEKVLEYPSKSMDLSFAIDGYWQPILVVINENLLADELTAQMEDEIMDRQGNDDRSEKYDMIYDIDKEPFCFTVDVSFETYNAGEDCVYPGGRVRINKIGIIASWSKDSEGLSKSLPVKWDKESLILTIELRIRPPYYL